MTQNKRRQGQFFSVIFLCNCQCSFINIMYLIVNTGSSSLKYKLFNSELEDIKTGNFVVGGKIHDHIHALDLMLSEISKNRNEIEKVGYRVVHGGDEADEIMPVTLPTMKIIEKYAPLAPHHNPAAGKVIRTLIEKIPMSQHFVVFDTAFFKNLPDVAKTYPIDKEIARELNIRRYGFHGISHEFAMEEVDPDRRKKVVTIHLGAGCSLAAINCGVPIDTSMGFTPVEGVPMQTRSGDLDPEIVIHLAEKFGLKKTRQIIENNSGLAGLSNTSGSMLTLLALAGEKVEDHDFHIGLDKTARNAFKEDAQLAIEIFCYRVKKYLGAYAAALGGVDIVAFTGEIGYGSSVIRDKILSDLNFLDFKVEIIKPDEELAIARKLVKPL